MQQPKQTEPKKRKAEFQQYEWREINRSQISTAEYNPRQISAHARKRLQNSLKTFGLVEPLVWNSRTGVLVGGHQRLSILDEQMGYGKTLADYKIGVSVVDLSPADEKRLNVILNNPGTQGTFDLDKLMETIGDAPLEDFELSRGDIEALFGDIPEKFFERPADADKPAEEVERELEEIKAARKRGKQRDDDSDANDAEYFLIVNFDNRAAKDGWLKANGFQEGVTHLTPGELEDAFRAIVAQQQADPTEPEPAPEPPPAEPEPAESE